jgi:hypothetical protein
MAGGNSVVRTHEKCVSGRVLQIRPEPGICFPGGEETPSDSSRTRNMNPEYLQICPEPGICFPGGEETPSDSLCTGGAMFVVYVYVEIVVFDVWVLYMHQA